MRKVFRKVGDILGSGFVVCAQVLIVCVVLFLIWFFLISSGGENTNPSHPSDMEKAYFEGQKDAINGDVRIRLNSDSTYIWIKSPWNDGTTPSYNPTYLESIHK